MRTCNFFKWILLFVLVLNALTMNAQIKSDTDDALDARQQSMVSISALTATGDLDNLKSQLNSGLDAGLTVNEIKEVLVQLYAYCGFPRSLNAIGLFMDVLEERKSKGINDNQGKEIGLRNDSSDKYEKGRNVLEVLSKTPQTKPAPGFGTFAPRIDAFLKEHLFADVFASDVLSYQQRELVTISALAAMTKVESQLQFHIGVGINTGLKEKQLSQVCGLIEKHIGRTQANVLRKSLGIPGLPVIREDMIVRMSEIEILPEFLDEYRKILTAEASASVKIEPGVITIFPMYQKENPTQVRIIEIYADKESYQNHLKTPHFQHYKTKTLPMVKSLKLVDMNGVDQEAMQLIFEKIK
jgi:4-carboxymuconolactone decarboxylase